MALVFSGRLPSLRDTLTVVRCPWMDCVFSERFRPCGTRLDCDATRLVRTVRCVWRRIVLRTRYFERGGTFVQGGASGGASSLWDSLLRARRYVGAGRCVWWRIVLRTRWCVRGDTFVQGDAGPLLIRATLSVLPLLLHPCIGDVVVPDVRREMFFAGVLLQMVPGGQGVVPESLRAAFENGI
jgi:hypothetical protein